MRRFISSYPISAFTALAFGFSWWLIPPVGLILPHGPLIAALVVTGASDGGAGLRLYRRQITRWRAPLRWYLLAAAIPTIVFLAASVVNVLLGAAIVQTGHRMLPGSLLLFVQLLFVGGQWEEPGWTGFALPLLEERLGGRAAGLALATLSVALIRIGWHIPLLLIGAIPWQDFLFYTLALQLMVSWLNAASRGIIPVVMVLHLGSNLLFALTSPFFAGADHVRFTWLYILFALSISLAGAIAFGAFSSVRRHQSI